MTRNEILIQQALDHAMDKDPETLRFILELANELKISAAHTLRIERVLHEMIKDVEGQRGTE